VSAPIPADGRWAVAAAENPVRRDSHGSGLSQRHAGGRARHTIGGLLEDAVMLLLVILLVPLAILLVGMPVALLVRGLLEIAKRM
jgi:hypothetical protein